MGSSEPSSINGEEDSRVEPISLSLIFEEWCPIYMVYGMTYEEFWYGDPFKAKFYREAFVLQEEKKDEQLWIQGVYIYEALCDVSPVLHAFSKSGTKPLPYLDKPLFSKYKEGVQEIDEQQKIENERLKAQVQFDSWMRATANHFNKN